MTLEEMAMVETMEGRHERALRLAGAASALKDEIGGGAPAELMRSEEVLEESRRSLDLERAEEAWNAGAEMAAKASAFSRTGWTPGGRARRGRPPKSWRKAFLDALSRMANVRVACEVAGVSRATAYRTRADNQTFARQWDEAIEAACDRLEQEAWRRGVAGGERPVTVAGEKEMVREYSDRMLEMLLKAHRPEKFRERYEVTTRVAGSDLDREIRELVEDLNRRVVKAGGAG
jgi:hypothetical protein